MILLIAVLLISSAYTDIKQNRIPNYFIVMILIFSMLYLLVNNPAEWWSYALSMAATLVLFFLLWVIGFLGAGDAKLAAAAALTLSFPDTYWFWILSIGGGVLFSILQMLRYNGPRAIIDILWRWWLSIMYKTDKRESSVTFPFAPVIALTWMVIVW
ncbi:prepilin peptidase [Salibacterium aidingense]|uniref:prepilin peptidase n=1 Tax=Salibacterium aidingense TaxID=384933 RepID=UPI001E5C1DC7|nr:prepilin peptidase [Salibacterium aidingense]